MGEDETKLEGLKPAINELLYQHLPGTTTLDEMEQVAVKIYVLVAKASDKEL